MIHSRRAAARMVRLRLTLSDHHGRGWRPWDRPGRPVLQRRTGMSGGDMMDGVAGGRLRSFVERIEVLEDEIKGLTEDKKEIYAEAKGDGFDVKILKDVVRLRKQDREEREERDTILNLYLDAIEGAPVAQAAE
jgi:uncharacterized protein (UPF0335 family)